MSRQVPSKEKKFRITHLSTGLTYGNWDSLDVAKVYLQLFGDSFYLNTSVKTILVNSKYKTAPIEFPHLIHLDVSELEIFFIEEFSCGI